MILNVHTYTPSSLIYVDQPLPNVHESEKCVRENDEKRKGANGLLGGWLDDACAASVGWNADGLSRVAVRVGAA